MQVKHDYINDMPIFCYVITKGLPVRELALVGDAGREWRALTFVERNRIIKSVEITPSYFVCIICSRLHLFF